MEESSSNLEAEIVGIHFSLATAKEIRNASVSGCPISQSSQITNPYLGLPLEYGKCEACGTSEIGKCEGHFGYIELPVPVYHPSYVMELKQMLNLLCLKCLKIKNQSLQINSSGFSKESSLCCKKLAKVSVREVKKSEGVLFLEVRVPATVDVIDWSFLKQYGFSYGNYHTRILLPAEVMEIIKRIPEATIMKLRRKGYFPQDGYIIRSLPVPPNCLYVPKVSDGITVFSNDSCMLMLKKVLRLVENIRKSRSGVPTFESHEAEATDLQLSVYEYLQVRGVGKPNRDKSRYGLKKDAENVTSTAWIQKIRDLFIRKGSGFSSRSVITGDTFIKVNEIGIPVEIAERIAFEERVSVHNQECLQKLVDDKQCLGFKEDSTLYSLKEGSKGHTSLRLGQIVLRAIKDGDVVFVNRPPTTHKHALQAFRVYIHEDHTVKVNPLICSPLSADFDGDCIHLFYPQSVASRAEVLELFSLEKQLLSSHNGKLLLQLTTDSILSMKRLLKEYNLLRPVAQDLILHACTVFQDSFCEKNLPKSKLTALNVLQACLPEKFDCFDGKLTIKESVIIDIDPSRDVSSIITTILESLFLKKGANAALLFLNSLQPVLMEYLYSNGYCFGLNDFCISKEVRSKKQEMLNVVGPRLFSLRSEFNEVENSLVKYYIKQMEAPFLDYLLNSSSVVDLINTKSSSAMKKITQQIGFLGLQIAEKGSCGSKNLVEDLSVLFESKYPCSVDYLSAKFGFVVSSLFDGLDPYEAIVHSTSVREVTLRSSQGLSEPGTLFKNLMAVLRDIVVCYDGTVRNISSNSIIQFEYATNLEKEPICAGEPVGVLAATALSNPAYKAVLDSSLDSNSSWNLMKEILRCSVSFKNNLNDRCVILYLNDCRCGNKYCLEKTAYTVKLFLEKVKLKSVIDSFWIEYMNYNPSANSEQTSRLCGHIHMNMGMLEVLDADLEVVRKKCEERLSLLGKRKVVGAIFKTVRVYISDTCTCPSDSHSPCLKFWFEDVVIDDLQHVSIILSDHVFTVLSETTIKGDDKIASVNVITVNPSATSWVRNPSKSNGSEIAVKVVLEKSAVKHRGDSWRVAMNCCLPVFHLIDTNRSIPYTVKDIQELIGVSSAFEQAVQRLTSSVSTVSKDVLHEHLILVASTMTCSGNMVGFNPGGYKAISKAFNLHEPFTEATLSAPKKCFERSAVKCHVDKLSSAVAACSWGKQVSVGTGSSFEILWNDKQGCFKQESVLNPYEYLNKVGYGNSDQPLSSLIDPVVDELMDGKRDWSPLDFGKDSLKDTDVTQIRSDNENHNSWLEKDPEIFAGFCSRDKVSALENTGWNAKDEHTPSSWNSNTSQEPVSGISSAWGSSYKESPSENVVVDMNERQKSSTWNANTSSEPPSGSAWTSSHKDGALENTGWGRNDGRKLSTWNDNTSSEPSSGSAWTSSHKDGALENTGWGMNDGGKSSTWNDNTSSEPPSGSGWTSSHKDGALGNAGWGMNDGGKSSTWNANTSSKPPSGRAWTSSYKEGSALENTGWGMNDGQQSASWTANTSNELTSGSAWITSDHDRALEKSGRGQNSTSWNANTSNEHNSQISRGYSGRESALDNTSDNSNWNSTSPNDLVSQVTCAWGSSTKENAMEPNQNSSKWKTTSNETASQVCNETALIGNKHSLKNTRDSHWRNTKSLHEPPIPGAWDSSPMENTFDDTRNSSGWNNDSVIEPATHISSAWKNSPTKNLDNSENYSGWDASSRNQSASHMPSAWGSSSKESELDHTRNSSGLNDKDMEKTTSSWHPNYSKEPDEKSNTKIPASSWGPSLNKSVSEDTNWTTNKSNEDESTRSSFGGWKSLEPSDNILNDSSNWGTNESEIAKNSWGSRNPSSDDWSSGYKNAEENEKWLRTRNARGPRDGWEKRSNRKREDWKNQKNQDRGVVRTETRKPLNLFTPEEQPVLADVDRLVRSIRKIIHLSGYNDEDLLSEEDRSFIVDNVLNFHPQKAEKIGEGIAHLMVSKSTKFPDTRCFYVVTSAGSRNDFSYLKCIDSYVRGKYPDAADDFLRKYFERRVCSESVEDTRNES